MSNLELYVMKRQKETIINQDIMNVSNLQSTLFVEMLHLLIILIVITFKPQINLKVALQILMQNLYFAP